MAEIKVTVDEKEYTKEQFKKDLVRMFDTFRDSDCSEYMGSATCIGVDCDDCPLYSNLYSCEDSKDDSFERIKIVHEWALEHPITTNRDVLKKTFGDDVFTHICSRVFEWEWLDQEYKSPTTKEEND